MECRYKKTLLINIDGSKIYVCSCGKSKCYGKEPKCNDCKEKQNKEIPA